jgi:hypothetical protein
MNREQVKEIVQLALELKPGDSMSIEVPSKNQGLSLRTMFYGERMGLLKKGIAMNVALSSIKQRKSDGQWLAIFTYEEPPKITIHKADGSSTAVELEVKASPIAEKEIPDDVMEILKKHRERKEEEENDK